MWLIENGESEIDAAFAALADPTRRAILARLAKGEATVMELAAPFEMTQPAISQHLRVLEDAGLVTHRIEGAKRPRRLARPARIPGSTHWQPAPRNCLLSSPGRSPTKEVWCGWSGSNRHSVARTGF